MRPPIFITNKSYSA